MNAPPSGPLYNDTNSTINHIGASYGGPAARFLQQPQTVMIPAVVQSASTSPAMAIDVDCGHLPHFHDDIWARPPAAPVSRVSQQIRSQQQEQQQSSTECDSPVYSRHDYNRYGHSEQQQVDTRVYPTQQTDERMDYPPPHPAYSSPTVISSGSPYYHHRQEHVPSATTRAAPVAVTAAVEGQGHMRVPVPSAPFANAGPPGVGVQFYPTPSQSSTYTSTLPHPYGYTCPYNPRQGGHASWVRMRNGVGCWSGLESYPFLLYFSFSSYLGLFCVSCPPACEFYDGSIPMLTTFSFDRLIIIHSIIYNPLLLLLQLSIHTITIIHPHLIGISPLHCHSISLLFFGFFPFFGCHIWTPFRRMAYYFFLQSAICSHNTLFSTLQIFFLVLNIATQIGITQTPLLWYITSEKISYSFD